MGTICFLQEPIEEWNAVKNMDGIPMLVNFYQNPKKYGFSFQMLVFFTRYQKLSTALKQNYKVIFTERNLESDYHIFAKMSYNIMKNMDKIEYDIYLMYYHEFSMLVEKIYIIYIESSIKVCFERIKKRNRDGEEKITLDYLETLENHHREWLTGKANVLIFNGNMDKEEHPKMFEEWIKKCDDLFSNDECK